MKIPIEIEVEEEEIKFTQICYLLYFVSHRYFFKYFYLYFKN